MMKLNLRQGFKIAFLIGMGLFLTSLFLDWYIIQAVNIDGQGIASWSFNPFTEWHTPHGDAAAFNTELKPENLGLPIVIHLVFLATTIASIFTVLFKDTENEKVRNLRDLNNYTYVMVFNLIVSAYYIMGFPVLYLYNEGLFFPFLEVNDPIQGALTWYQVGPGYIFQMIGFVLTFPYVLFYQQTLLRFESDENDASSVVKKVLEEAREEIDIDKLIAEETLKLKMKSYRPRERMIERYFVEGQP